jgi:hypothetical protein
MKPFRTNWESKSAKDARRYPIYRDRANGTIEHYTNVDGQRIMLARSYAENEVNRGYARYIDLWEAT